jgi:hypothetical protein
VKVSIGSWDVTDRYRDDNGLLWAITKLTGWRDSPGIRADLEARPAQAGMFDGPGYASGRVVVIEGSMAAQRTGLLSWATMQAALQNEQERIQALLLDGSDDTLTVTANGRTLQSRVRLSDQITCDPVGGQAGYSWSVQLTAPDPVRYGSVEQDADTPIYTDPSGGLEFPLAFPLSFGPPGTGGWMVLDNPGTAPTWPVFTISGPTAGLPQKQPVLIAPDGGRLAYLDALAAGEYLEIDTHPHRKRVLAQGTASRRNRMSAADFGSFAVPPGGQLRVFFSTVDYPNPTSRAAATWRAGWW